MKTPYRINYVYYVMLFLILSLLHSYHILLIDSGTLLQRTFYVIYAVGQCFLEVLALVTFSRILTRGLSPTINWWIHQVFILFTFLLFLAHVIDFPLIRIMDMTLWAALDLVLAESWGNFVEMLKASNVPLQSWILAGLAALLLPILGLVCYRVADYLSQKKPLYFSFKVMGFTLFSTTLFLTTFDYRMSKVATPSDDSRFLKALPWKTTLMTVPYPKIFLGKKLSFKFSEEHYLSELDHYNLKIEKKPNIFLFVIESLREDFLKHEIAPHLARFREANGNFHYALAGSNATPSSWFSIFHSVHTFQWAKRQPSRWSSGSLPLQILKKAGYKIHLYSSSQLEYYHMDEILLGKGRQLADTYRFFGADPVQPIYANDRNCVHAVMQHLEKEPEGNLFLIFLDSTHFDYSWPEDSALDIAPEKIDYLSIACAKGVEGVKKRYCNAVHFIDQLWGQFFAKLQMSHLGEEAAVIVTGDHGEEFYEQGQIFHASRLSSMQTHFPIYYRLPSASRSFTSTEITSHVDIFPTLLDYIFGHDLFENWFDGESLFKPRKNKFALSARFNGNRTPYEFLIHTGEKQCIARFENQSRILKSRALHVVGCRDEHDQPLELDLSRIQHDFKHALQALFTRD